MTIFTYHAILYKVRQEQVTRFEVTEGVTVKKFATWAAVIIVLMIVAWGPAQAGHTVGHILHDAATFVKSL